jgi:hypothetical protein
VWGAAEGQAAYGQERSGWRAVQQGRTRTAGAARERAQQAARQDIAEKSAADRVAAEVLEEEERDEAAAQTKVRVAPPSSHIGLHSVQLGGERCGVSVARVSAFSR